MPKLLVSVLILDVAIVALAGLAYQTVPMSTTQTIVQYSTVRLKSYSSYMAIQVSQYITTTYAPTTATYVGISNCLILYNSNGEPVTCTYVNGPTWTDTSYVLESFVAQTSYEEQTTATFPYNYLARSSITESSISVVPVYSSFGLSGTSFGTLSILVVCFLAVVTVGIALKSRPPHRPKQATMSQFMKPSWVKCGAELLPNSNYCNACGAKQLTNIGM